MSPDRRDISRDRWDVSPGQTGRTPGGVPPKFFMFIGFFFFPIDTVRISEAWEPPQFQEKRSERKGHSRSSGRVPGYSRSSSRSSKNE